MAKQKYVKVQVSLGIGNRKSQVCDPVEVDDDVNYFDGELNTLVLDFADAIKALPSTDAPYTIENVKDAVCACFNLQRVPVV